MNKLPRQLELEFEAIQPSLLQLMTVDDIYDRADESLLTSLDEDRRIERKPAGFTGDSLGEYFAMWANTSPDGGLIVSGQLDKTRGFEGCSRLSTEKLNRLEECGRTYCPDAKYKSKRVKVTNLTGAEDFVVLFRVYYQEKVVAKTVGGKVFKRIADNCIEIKSPGEIRELQADKGEICFELEPSLLKWPEDFDRAAVAAFVSAVRIARQYDERLSNIEVLELRRLGKRESSGAFTPNVACALLFANDPQLVCPGCKVRFQRFESNKEETGERYNAVKDLVLEGTVSSLITQVATTLESQLRTFSPLVAAGGKFQSVPEYPRLAWYEAVVNACVHRSYGNGMKNIPIFVRMFDDRLEIESPGPFPPCVTVANIYETHNPRNPHMMEAMLYLEYVKCAGGGTRRIRDTMLAMKLPEPEFSQPTHGHVWVKVTLRNLIRQRSPAFAGSRENDRQEKAKDKRGGLETKEGGSSRNRAGLKEGGGGDGDDVSDVSPEQLPEHVADELPHLGKKATKAAMRKAILVLCSWRALMPSEIAYYLKRDVKKLVSSYISGMHAEGVLDRTIPDVPMHPAQKYKASQVGILELLN